MPSLPQWNAWLLEQRTQRKLSQERFAELVGVSKRNIERWEKGMTPRLASRNLVEQALNEEGPGVSTDDALDEIRAALAHIAEVVGVTPAQMTAPAAAAAVDPQSKAALVLLAELSAEVERLTEHLAHALARLDKLESGQATGSGSPAQPRRRRAQ
jgi:transcriptional regulator with XRE-family HTH domain